MKNVFKFFLSVLLLVVSAFCVVSCKNTQNSEYSSNHSSGSTTASITQSQAILYAKNSSTVINKIVNLYGLKYYYTPDWGTATATENVDGSWAVKIKGTISGYADDYKSDFVYRKKFTVTANVYSSGFIGSIYATKY